MRERLRVIMRMLLLLVIVMRTVLYIRSVRFMMTHATHHFRNCLQMENMRAGVIGMNAYYLGEDHRAVPGVEACAYTPQ